MRVIEPQQLHRRSSKKKRRPYVFFLFICLFGIAGYLLVISIKPKKVEPRSRAVQSSQVTVKEATTTPKNTFKQLTNEEFVSLYSSFAYPNTVDIVTPPVITNSPEADIRIRQLAETRGYRLRSAPIVRPVQIADGYLLQQKASQPLQDLITAAKAENLQITITAAFRSIDEQRSLFNARLSVSAADIAAGKVDAAVIDTLKTTAPPGYSRHHNGFTVDVACGSVGLYAFLDTPCFKWLSKDNFKIAKEFGWIPSYPGGINSSGPEPEPWEYVWVGRDALLE